MNNCYIISIQPHIYVGGKPKHRRNKLLSSKFEDNKPWHDSASIHVWLILHY